MKLPVHAVTSAAFAGAVYAVTRSEAAALAVVVSGVFIDLDHVLDFLVDSGEDFSISNFFSWCEEMRGSRLFIWLHSLEFLALLAGLAVWLRSDVLFGAVLGAGVHLVIDQIGNRRPLGYERSAWFYFLAYRWRSAFRISRMYRNWPRA